MKVTRKACTIVASFLVATPVALAQGVGGSSPTETWHVLERVQSIPEDPIHWGTYVGTASNPIPVELDPRGPAWLKHFQTEDAVPIVDSLGVLHINEYLTIDGSRPWIGWCEEIANPNFEAVLEDQYAWPVTRILVDGAAPPGLAIEYIPPSATEPGRILFSFDALEPGTEMTIQTRLKYTGSEPFTESLDIYQYPLPEPMTASLMALGGAMLLTRRRRTKTTA